MSCKKTFQTPQLAKPHFLKPFKFCVIKKAERSSSSRGQEKRLFYLALPTSPFKSPPPVTESDSSKDLPEPERLPRWELRALDFALFPCLVLTSILAMSLLFVSGYNLLSGSEIDDESLIFGIVAGAGTQAGLLAAFLLFRRFTPIAQPHDKSASLGFAMKVGFAGLVATYLALIPLNYFWEGLLNSLELPDQLQLPVTMLQQGGTPLEMILMGILIIFIAPICEEITYRGVFFRYLVGRFPAWVAITLSAAVFSLMHYNLYSSFPLFVLGCGLAIVYQKSGNIMSSIFMHSLFNTISFIVITTTDLGNS